MIKKLKDRYIAWKQKQDNKAYSAGYSWALVEHYRHGQSIDSLFNQIGLASIVETKLHPFDRGVKDALLSIQFLAAKGEQ